MIEPKKDIVCVAFPAWKGNYLKSTVQLMTELALHGHHILYVNYAFTWKDFILSLFGKGYISWKRLSGFKPRLSIMSLENGAEIHLLTLPPILPINFIKSPMIYDAIHKINTFFIKRAILKAMESIGMTAPTVVNAFNPTIGNALVGQLNESKLIYYCYDEIGSARWASRHGKRLEDAFIKKADTVIVTSQGLFDKKSKEHNDCHLIKNGVDFKLFSKKSENLPAISFESDKKVIGYLGSVDERVDYDLLEKLISTTPQYDYVFVGRVTQSAYEKRLLAFPNVQLMGSQPPPTLPAWVQKFDVCLIPFLKNELTAGIYPLKINEYLAAGKPVVSTRFANLSDFETVVQIADNDDSFLQLVQKEYSNEDAARFRQFASQNSWAARSKAFSELL